VKKVFFISGPTASGKTSTSINLCKKLNETGIKSEIVNFDSLLFYKELNIGTAKPTLKEMDGCTHHLVSFCSAKDPINASDFLIKAEEILNKLLTNNITPIFVGGSAFYLRAFIKGMYDSAPISDEIKKEAQSIYEERGIEYIRDFLKENDHKSFENLHENDHYRNIRAYEYFQQNKTPISKQKEVLDKNDPYDFSKNRFTDIDFYHIYLDLNKEDHWKIILDRCTQMVKDGLVKEMKDLLDNGFTGEEKPLKSIGYKETYLFIDNGFKTQEEYIERMAISTRQLAKSQRTFFNKVQPKNSYHPINDKDLILRDALSFIKKN
jgi:tRNA dimethylallyltransferase